MTINALFEQAGETVFRRTEAQALDTLLNQREPHVIALGGGSLLDKTVRTQCQAHALIIGLTTDVATLSRRLNDAEDRPLLQGENRATLIAALLRRRALAYQDVDVLLSNPDGELETTVNTIVATVARWERAA